MVVEVIYIVRHGHRMNWTVDPISGEYSTATRTPTGIPCDPQLASYGVQQSRQLADHLITLDPPLDAIYSSPFYRCLQTLKPTINRLISEEKIVKSVRVDRGVGEFFGKARFQHPRPPTLEILQNHFDFLNHNHESTIIPPSTGETMQELHDRNAYALHRIISQVDAEPGSPKSILICTHAASMICMGRALTGHMPEDPTEEDFHCGTCALSKYVRRESPPSARSESSVGLWNPEKPERVPVIDWKNGKGVKGGWECVWNGDCSFLEGGEERTWHFSMDLDEYAPYSSNASATDGLEEHETQPTQPSLSFPTHAPLSPATPNVSRNPSDTVHRGSAMPSSPSETELRKIGLMRADEAEQEEEMPEQASAA